MKKIIIVFLFIFSFSLPFCQELKVNADSSTNTVVQVSETGSISLVKIYNSFEDVVKTGDQIYFKNDDISCFLSFQSAYRIGHTEKFKVTYVSISNPND